jgi:hypothetical protein
MLRPDRRWFIWVDAWTAAASSSLIAAVADDLGQDLYTTIDEGDDAELRDWEAAGFTVHRREHNYRVPTDLGGTRPSSASTPSTTGISIRPPT